MASLAWRMDFSGGTAQLRGDPDLFVLWESGDPSHQDGGVLSILRLPGDEMPVTLLPEVLDAAPLAMAHLPSSSIL